MRRFIGEGAIALARKLFDHFRVKAIAVGGLSVVLATGSFSQSALADGAWVNSLTGKTVNSAPAGGAEVDLLDGRTAHNPLNGANYYRDEACIWRNSLTGKAVQSAPAGGAEVDLLDGRSAHNPLNGANYHWDPKARPLDCSPPTATTPGSPPAPPPPPPPPPQSSPPPLPVAPPCQNSAAQADLVQAEKELADLNQQIDKAQAAVNGDDAKLAHAAKDSPDAQSAKDALKADRARLIDLLGKKLGVLHHIDELNALKPCPSSGATPQPPPPKPEPPEKPKPHQHASKPIREDDPRYMEGVQLPTNSVPTQRPDKSNQAGRPSPELPPQDEGDSSTPDNPYSRPPDVPLPGPSSGSQPHR